MKRVLLVFLALVLFSSSIWAASLIQIRRDLAGNWTAANPILAQGEMGLEIDTLKLKFGDGNTVWNYLAYYSTSIVTIADTNWQTSYPLFDQNMGARYSKITDTNAGISDINVFNRCAGDANSVLSTSGCVSIKDFYKQGTGTGSDANKAGAFDANVIANPPWITSYSDTNWETSFPILDENLKLTYFTQTDAFAQFVSKFGDTMTGTLDFELNPNQYSLTRISAIEGARGIDNTNGNNIFLGQKCDEAFESDPQTCRNLIDFNNTIGALIDYDFVFGINFDFQKKAIYSSSDSDWNLGQPTNKWANLFLNGILSDGDNNVTIANISKVTDTNAAIALRGLISDINGADALRVLLSDTNNASRINYTVIANPPWITSAGIDTNWQTSYPAFDANMALQYYKQTDANNIFTKISDVNGTYAKTSDINNAFLRNADVNMVYVRQTDGNEWYAKISDINSSFLRNTDINFVYVRQSDGNSWYAKVSDVNGTFANISDINGTYAKISDVNSVFLRSGDVNGLYSKITDVNGTYAKTSDVNAAYLNRLTGGIVAKDLNVSTSAGKGVNLHSDENRICFGGLTTACLDWNGTVFSFGG